MWHKAYNSFWRPVKVIDSSSTKSYIWFSSITLWAKLAITFFNLSISETPSKFRNSFKIQRIPWKFCYYKFITDWNFGKLLHLLYSIWNIDLYHIVPHLEWSLNSSANSCLVSLPCHTTGSPLHIISAVDLADP